MAAVVCWKCYFIVIPTSHMQQQQHQRPTQKLERSAGRADLAPRLRSRLFQYAFTSYNSIVDTLRSHYSVV